MKRKAIPALCAAGLLALALTGCGGGTAGGQAEYIGIDAAKAVALEAAGVAEDDAVFSTAGLDKRNGMDYYAVDFTAGGRSYEYDIDAVTGVVIDSSSGGGTAEPPARADHRGPGRGRHRGAGQGDRPEPRGPHRRPGHLRPQRAGSGRRPADVRRGVLHQRLQGV